VPNSKDITHTREVVGILSDRAQFQAAVDGLMAAGFDRSEISVLSSHDSLEAAGQEGKPWRDVLTAMVGELRFEGPLVAAGLIALAAGPVGAAIAALVAAGVGGAAAKELLDEVTAVPDSEDFARALAAGSVILWVAVADDGRAQVATSVLTSVGATNVHAAERTVRKP
jgi:hypothetical protein